MTSRLVSLLLCFLALAASLAAQTARWEPNGGTLGVGHASDLSLVFEQCEPKGDPTLPSIPGLSLRITGRSQSISMVNFSMSKTVTLSLVARLTERKAIEAAADDEGWASLSAVGSHISKQASFDSRNYGYAKLSGLFQAIGLFDVRTHGKVLQVRDPRAVR